MKAPKGIKMDCKSRYCLSFNFQIKMNQKEVKSLHQQKVQVWMRADIIQKEGTGK